MYTTLVGRVGLDYSGTSAQELLRVEFAEFVFGAAFDHSDVDPEITDD